jgi:GT2 family glycosyltransferase
MAPYQNEPPVTICVLTFADHPDLAERAIGSILQHVERPLYALVVGANAVGARTRRYLEKLQAEGALDQVVLSDVNLGKSPMMRRMFERVRSEFIWWFDDDSFVISPQALPGRLRIARAAAPEVVMWGEQYLCESAAAIWHDDPVAWVRAARWYRKLPPPFWQPGGKGEFDFMGQGKGDGRWFFLHGAGWFARTEALRALDWPDPRLQTFGEDVFLGEAIRQQGWKIEHIGKLGVEINAADRRWEPQQETAPRSSPGR